MSDKETPANETIGSTDDGRVPISELNDPGMASDPVLRLHPSTITDLALAIAGCLELPVGQERGHELFLNEAATQPIMVALADGVREVMKDYLAHEEAIPIAKVTLIESVRVGPKESQHIIPESLGFDRLKIKMEWASGVLWVRWQDTKGESQTLVIPSANIRHMTPE